MTSQGLYYWAGPGTERMIQLKYPGSKINSQSFQQAYDLDQLEKAKVNFGVTDAWVSYSWGFSPKTEKLDYQFLRNKLDNFQQLGLKTHAYIQGTNLVIDDHGDIDYYCRNHRDQLIPYHRGRKMTCVNNPHFLSYLKYKVDLALTEEISGVFVDNLHFGLFPLVVGRSRVSFFGCRCQYCQKLFKKETGGRIPDFFYTNSSIYTEYLNFRTRSMERLVKNLSVQVHARGKVFGSNSFDPKLNSKLFCGIDLETLEKYQDYLLFENHDLPRKKRNNSSINSILKNTHRPVYIVSYKKGIGREKVFTQTEFNAIYTEADKLGYYPCYKASEYTTDGVWHALDFSRYQPLQKIENLDLEKPRVKHKKLPFSALMRVYNRWYVPGLNLYFENRLARKSFSWLYHRALG